ncbi:phage protein Gp37 [Thioalkalivibrio sp. ALMg9]|uniref:phage protein Gp37 n=1 Tax=Thioalkalivibrio sp. ALMg9 TaxID=1266912 RepID=UPI0003822F0F|nr:phage protein Gp37 [Thioalkalivibrio sp. ALMg9]
MLARVEDAMMERTQTVVGEHVQVIEDLPGRWDERTLRAALRRVPGIYIAWSGARQAARESQQPEAVARYVAYVVTGHASGERERRRGNQRQVGAYELIQRLVPGLHGLTVQGIGTLAFRSIENLYSDRFDKEGVVVYGIEYHMGMTFPPAFDAADLAPFETYHATHRVGDDQTPDAYDQVSLPQED